MSKQNYIGRIAAMSDDELFHETKQMVWLSAYASNNPHSDYHWKCDETYSEWNRRGKLDEYSRAHKQVQAEI